MGSRPLSPNETASFRSDLAVAMTGGRRFGHSVSIKKSRSMTTQTQPTETVLDHVDNIRVPGTVFREPTNEYWALICLRDGLEFLYAQAKQCDHAVGRRIPPRESVNYFGFGNVPEFEQIPKTLLTCAFQWYAVSACQYVRTIGAIAHRHDPARPLPPAYVQYVIPEVQAYRDKVAAHFAWSTQNQRDNDAERLASVIPPLSIHDGSIHVGVMAIYVRRGSKASDSSAIKPWSITRVHEHLRKRYWPEYSLGSTETAIPMDSSDAPSVINTD